MKPATGNINGKNEMQKKTEQSVIAENTGASLPLFDYTYTVEP